MMNKLLLTLVFLIACGPCLFAQVAYSDSLYKAAADSIPEAQYHLGLCYENGNGIGKNLETATQWFAKAARQGHVDAQYKYGFNLFTGKGITKDKAEAYSWLSDAANGGNTDAQVCLAYLYKVGDGVPADLVQAYFWASVAAASGDTRAQEYKQAYGAQLGSVLAAETDANVEKFLSAKKSQTE